MRIAILGTRGIPARYGGFETFAEELSTRLVSRGHRVTVYCRERPEQPLWRGVDLRYLPALRSKYLETLQHTFCSTVDLMTLATSRCTAMRPTPSLPRSRAWQVRPSL